MVFMKINMSKFIKKHNKAIVKRQIESTDKN